MPRRKVKPSPRSYPLVEFLFVAGTLLVILGFFYALQRSWPALDPLSLVMLVGIGLLLIVVCERLRLMLRELQELTAVIRRATVAAPEDAPR
jgi:hypothetical protein